MHDLHDSLLDCVGGGDGPFNDGDSLTMNIRIGNGMFGGGASMTLGPDTLNNATDALGDALAQARDAALDLMLGPGPSAFSASAQAPAFSAVAGGGF